MIPTIRTRMWHTNDGWWLLILDDSPTNARVIWWHEHTGAVG